MPPPKTLTDADFALPKTLTDSDFASQPTPTPAFKPPTAGEQIANFPKEHPYITAAASLIPGVGGLIGGLTDPTGQVGRGALKKAGRDLYDVTGGAGPLGMAGHYLAEKTGLGDKIRKATEPSNPQQEVGGYGTTAAELALPMPKAAGLLPSTARAGENFNKAMALAKDVPVNTSHFEAPLLRAAEIHANTRAPLPGIMQKGLQDIAPSTAPRLNYRQARDMAIDSGQQAVQSSMAPRVLARPIKKLLTPFGEGLDTATQEAANVAGPEAGRYHALGMKEYHNAMRLKEGTKTAGKILAPIALGAAGYKGARALGYLGD